MHFTSGDPIRRAVDFVRQFVPNRPSHTVLAGIRIQTSESSESSVALSAFDLSLGIEIKIPVVFPSLGIADDVSGVVVEGKLFATLIKDSTGELEISSDNENPLKVAYGSSKVQLPLLSGLEEWPDYGVSDESSPIEIDMKALCQLIKSCLYATSTDESKQVLTGVCLVISPGGMEAAATDGHRLAVALSGKIDKDAELQFVIPAAAMRQIVGFVDLAGKDAAWSVTSSNGAMMLKTDGGACSGSLYTRLIEGQYPNYRQLIPTKFARTAKFERLQLINLLTRAMKMAEMKNNLVKFLFDFAAQEVTVDVEAPDVGHFSGNVPAHIEHFESNDETFAVALNGKYLLETLKSFGAENVELKMNTPTSPIVAQAIGESSQALIMPVQLRN